MVWTRSKYNDNVVRTQTLELSNCSRSHFPFISLLLGSACECAVVHLCNEYEYVIHIRQIGIGIAMRTWRFVVWRQRQPTLKKHMHSHTAYTIHRKVYQLHVFGLCFGLIKITVIKWSFHSTHNRYVGVVYLSVSPPYSAISFAWRNTPNGLMELLFGHKATHSNGLIIILCFSLRVCVASTTSSFLKIEFSEL